MMKNHLVLLYLLIEVTKNLIDPKNKFFFSNMYFNYHTLSLGDNDCILFVVVDSIIGDDGALTICGK